jgi:predicted DNA-binding protein YlxM (UPF0122 family)
MLDVEVSRIIDRRGCRLTTMLLQDRIAEAVQTATAKGYGVSAIANACGITRQAIYQWMDGSTASLDGINLVVLSEFSGYNARWIINGTGQKMIEDDPPLSAATPQQLTDELLRRMAGALAPNAKAPNAKAPNAKAPNAKAPNALTPKAQASISSRK